MQILIWWHYSQNSCTKLTSWTDWPWSTKRKRIDIMAKHSFPVTYWSPFDQNFKHTSRISFSMEWTCDIMHSSLIGISVYCLKYSNWTACKNYNIMHTCMSTYFEKICTRLLCKVSFSLLIANIYTFLLASCRFCYKGNELCIIFVLIIDWFSY